MNSPTKKESYSLLKSLIALILIAGCLWAAQWQYHRGIARHARNTSIETNSNKTPLPLASLTSDVVTHEWQPATTQGKFDSTSQILLRNHYSDGVYGYELLTRFTAEANAQSGKTSENFYLDLLSGSDTHLNPKVPAELPELSDGPHMAYALQWLFFAGLIVYGRFLIRRDVLTHKEL